MFIQPLKWGLSHSRLLRNYLGTVLPAAFCWCSWKRKDQLKLISLTLSYTHKVPFAPLENEVSQDMINVMKKSQSTAVVEHKIPNSNILE